MDIYDLIVLGTGTAATTAAHKCASAGWRVAIVDELPYGGTCPLRGCDPKKILRRGAEVASAARLMDGKGIRPNEMAVDWADLVSFKRSFTEAMPDRIEGALRKQGIVTLHGSARFTGPDTVAIGRQEYKAQNVLIATGAGPRPLDEPGAQHLVDNAGFMELDKLPKRVLFVGGGYVSFEFAHICARVGSKVTIISRDKHLLKAFDPDLVDRLVARSREEGMDIELATSLLSVERRDGAFVVTGEREGKRLTWEVDLVVHGAGRTPAVEALELETAGVDFSKKGVTVDATLRSVSNPSVFAAGDVADTPGAPLTPVAAIEGKVAASNMLRKEDVEPDYSGVPSVVFTIPELARVGMLEAEAKETGRNVSVRFNDTGDWFSNMRVGESCAAVKILVDENSDEILGAHLIGPGYAELVNLFGLAIKVGLTATELKSMTPAYPTVGSDIGSML